MTVESATVGTHKVRSQDVPPKKVKGFNGSPGQYRILVMSLGTSKSNKILILRPNLNSATKF